MEKFEILTTKIDDLKKIDKKSMQSLYVFWLESNKPSEFTIPLMVSTEGKGILTINSLRNCLYAFMYRSRIFWNLTLNESSDDDGNKFATVTLKDCGKFTVEEFLGFIELSNLKLGEPKKADTKRESSAKTKAKSEAKKSAKQEEMDAEVEKWNHEKTKQILDVVNAKCKLTAKDYNDLQCLILKILEK